MGYKFNPFIGNLDIAPTVDTSSFATSVPRVVANGVTYTVPTNVQVSYSSQIYIQAGGQIAVRGTGSLIFKV